MSKRKELTIKEAGFIKDLLETGNQREAVLRNYNVKSKEVATTIGKQLRKKPHIKEAIQKALEKKGLTIERLADNIKDIANIPVQKADARTVLSANIEVLKMLGAYDKQDITTEYKATISKLPTSELMIELSKRTKSSLSLIEEVQELV